MLKLSLKKTTKSDGAAWKVGLLYGSVADNHNDDATNRNSKNDLPENTQKTVKERLEYMGDRADEKNTHSGYTSVGDRIAAHKSGTTGAVYVRTGSTVTETDNLGNSVETFAFKTGNVITGHGAIAPHSFVPTDNEPLFLSSTGIFALTASDVTGERYVQSRSFYINPKLLSESNIADAYYGQKKI